MSEDRHQREGLETVGVQRSSNLPGLPNYFEAVPYDYLSTTW